MAIKAGADGIDDDDCESAEALLQHPSDGTAFKKSKTLRSRYTSIVLKAFVILLAALGFIDVVTSVVSVFLKQTVHTNSRQITTNTAVQSQQHQQPLPQPCYCGTSTVEARLLNCTFSPMAAAWLPPHCQDAALSAQFDTAGPGPNGSWSYYADHAGTIPMTISEVEALADTGGEFHTTMGWHIKHCTYYWRKGFRGVVDVEPRYRHESHIEHCEKVLLLRYALEDVLTGSQVLLDSS